MAALNRIILALALVLFFGLHEAMQCQAFSTVSAASHRCAHEHGSSDQRSTPPSPAKGCCSSFTCLSYAERSGIEVPALNQAAAAHFEAVSSRVSIFPSAAAAHSPRIALSFHSPPAPVPFFVTHHAFLI